jgi:hypothetical protein
MHAARFFGVEIYKTLPRSVDRVRDPNLLTTSSYLPGQVTDPPPCSGVRYFAELLAEPSL